MRRTARRLDRVSAAHRLIGFPAATRIQVPAVWPRLQPVRRGRGRRRGLDAGIPSLSRQSVRPPHFGSKVFSQIDGGGVAATCFVPPCLFTVTPTTQTVSAAGGTFTAVVTRTSGENCTFGAESLGSFVSIMSGAGGSSAPTTVTYTVAPNSGVAVHVDSRPLDEQLDVARDQSGRPNSHRVHHDGSEQRHRRDDDLLDQIDVYAVRVCSDGAIGSATYTWPRATSTDDGHAQPERH